MIQPTLLVMAAGMGSRYGGLKQIDPVGPGGETIIDYSVYDALRAGFGRLVFVIRREMESTFTEIIGSRFKKRLPVDYVFQEIDRLPAGFAVPPGRKKPWGTGHAVLMAADVIQGPFGVINADDFYGWRSYETLAGHLRSESACHALVGFVLKNTLSEFGPVARGVCQTAADGSLQDIVELTHIERDGEAARHTDPAGNVRRLTGSETVSMNMWGFHPSFFNHLEHEFSSFLEKRGTDEKAEFYIPSAVNTFIKNGRNRLEILRTPDSWFGVTYREDRSRVSENLRRLIERGDYPERLWS